MINVHASSDEDESTKQTKVSETVKSSEEVAETTVENTGAISNDSIKNGLIQIGSENAFEQEDKPVFAKITTYGTDCDGCYNVNGYGGSAGGVKLSFNSVQQSNGSWLEGITYDGYYIVAANSSIPMGSIIEVSNHGLSGYGLQEGQPFYAMVLDRGAMTLNHLDLFVGSEKSNGLSINRSYSPTMKIVRYGY
ncbi:MAG: hypothetical protein PHQ89_05250 [Bacilli bacterium]|nr:hypothetical protein [Bacilli bacterium]